jgi:transposase-like protein
MNKRKRKPGEDFDYKVFEADAIERLQRGESLIGKDGIFTELIQRIVNSALEGEMDGHLRETREEGSRNRRNGHTHKQLRTSLGPVGIEPPRDREGSFSPRLVRKWDREMGTGLEEQILSLYGMGNSIEDIRKQLSQFYGLEYSHGTISAVTERVWEEVVSWQQRPLLSCYPVIYLDAIFYKIRVEGKVSTQAIYTVYGISPEGERDVLALHIGESEGARHWGLILEDLRRRGVEEVLFFCVDGLSGLPEAIEAVYPRSRVQPCIVHKVRSSTRFVADKYLKALCKDLRRIYTAADLSQAEAALEALSQNWDSKYPEVSRVWRRDWDALMGFMDFGEHIRRMIYTTNSVEALHRIMRKTTKTKGAWVNEKGLLKQLYLALKFNQSSWKRKVYNWNAIQRELTQTFGENYTKWIPETY